MFDGVSLLIFFILGLASAIALREMIRHLLLMRRLKALQRDIDFLDSSLDALEAEDFLGPRPW